MSEIVDCIAWVVRKIAWSFWVFLKFLGKRLLDLLGLIFNLAACCTIIRFPFMVVEFTRLNSFWEWRTIGLYHLFFFVIDLPVIAMGLFIMVTVVRAPKCCKELKETFTHWEIDSFNDGWKLRAVVVKHFFKSWIDIFCIPTALLVVMSWRSVIFVRKMKKATSTSKRRKHCFIQFFHLLVDIFLLPFFLSMLSWRLPFIIQKVRKGINEDDKWNKLRFIGLKESVYLLLDVPCIMLFFATSCTWRLPMLIFQIKQTLHAHEYNKQMHVRKTIILQFLSIFLDIPCIISSLIVLLSLWHLPSLIKEIKKRKNKSSTSVYQKEMEIRGVCLLEFGMIIMDVLCLLCFLVVFCTLWRAYPLIKNIIKYYKKYNNQQMDERHENDSANQESPQCRSEGNDAKEFEQTEKEPQEKVKIEEIVFHETEKESSVNSTDDSQQIDMSENQPDTEPTKNINENDEIKTTEKNKKFSMWKIRKTIAIQFVFLFIDLPAIPLCIFLMITGLRTTKLLSELLGGDFYTMFAITVYYQFLHFLIELIFIVIFLFLAIRKPIHLWTVLLEDEEHKSKRLLCHIMQWLPDIAKGRHQYYERLDEIVALNFKQKIPRGKTLATMNEVFEPFIKRLEEILYRLEKYEIEDEYVYLVKCAIFGEKKRVEKKIRYFVAEKNFLQRPNIDIHERNKQRLKLESIKYNKEIDETYKKLLNYKPNRVPLYESKSGLSIRTREETKRVLIYCLPRDDFLVALGCLVCILPLYRAPTMIKKLFTSWYNRVEILKDTLYEYGLDIATILRMLFVVVFIYRAPFMFADVLDCIIKKRSWKAVRKTVKNYPGFIMEDLFKLVVNLFSWNTLRFIFTAILFGVLMPADLFLTVCKSCFKNKCSFIVTALLYTVFMGFPFVFSFYGGEKILEAGFTTVNIAVLCVFFAALLVILLMMVVAITRDSDNFSFSLKMPEVDYVRYSWYNFHVILFEVLEFFQAIALIFKLPSIPMYGSQELSIASKYFLFSFVPFKPILWMTVAFFIVWFFLCAAPIIFENILETYPIGTFSKRPSWRFLISIFANTLFLTFVENLVSLSACTYTQSHCPRTDLLLPVAQNICVTSTFIEDTSFSCWTNPHRNYAAFGLIALVWYVTTALIFDSQYGDPDTSEQDIGFSPIYNTVINVFKAMMVVVVTIITNDQTIPLVCLLVLNFLSVLFTFLFKIMFKFYPCNVPGFLVWRAFTFVSSCLVSIAVLVAYAIDNNESMIPLIIIGAGIGVALLISVIITLKLRNLSDTERDRQTFQKEIQMLEKRLEKNKWLLSGWHKKRNIWYRLIKSVRSAQKRDKFLTTNLKTSMAKDNKRNYETFKVVHTNDNQINPPPTIPPPVETLNLPSPLVETLNLSPPPVETLNLSTPSVETLNLPPPPSFEAVERNQDLYDLAEVQSAMFSDDILKLEKNGRNLLLVLEKYIDHKAYTYSFFTQRELWLHSVWNCNWTNVLQCLRVLNSNLQGTFDRPTHLDVSLAQTALENDELNEDPQDNLEPPLTFVRQTKEMIANTTKECREKALSDVSQCEIRGAEWKIVMEKLLPDIPVIRSWEYDCGKFTLTLRKHVTGTITDIEDDGNKLAKGANIKIGKKLAGEITGNTIKFYDDGQPTGSKGPVNVALKEISFVKKNNKLYILVNQKNKVPLATVIASSKTISWE